MNKNEEAHVHAIVSIISERQRQEELKLGGDTEKFDATNTQNDWIAYINTYLGRATQKVASNEIRGEKFEENMIKAGALCLAALEAHHKGYC